MACITVLKYIILYEYYVIYSASFEIAEMTKSLNTSNDYIIHESNEI